MKENNLNLLIFLVLIMIDIPEIQLFKEWEEELEIKMIFVLFAFVIVATIKNMSNK